MLQGLSCHGSGTSLPAAAEKESDISSDSRSEQHSSSQQKPSFAHIQVQAPDSPRPLRLERPEIGRTFQHAVGAHEWSFAQTLVARLDRQRLNDGLCVVLDSVWFLTSEEEVENAMKLIENLVSAGANDFPRAVLRTSFLASCVSACRSRAMSLADTVTVMAQRLRDRLKECSGDELMKAEAAVKVQKFTEWALKCIGSHSRRRSRLEDTSHMARGSFLESRMQLRAFKRFMHLAGRGLNRKDYSEAFDAACFPLTLFSGAIDPGWASGISASIMQGLLTVLVEGGADNVNQCFLEAARFGSTELVRILMQIAHQCDIELDVDLALSFASYYCKTNTMECLVDDGNTDSFLGPLMRAAERGCMPVVHWFVERGCKDMELCLALTAAASSSQLEVLAYLLDHVPQHVIHALSLEILKAAGERSVGSFGGINFLFCSDFLDNPDATYQIANKIAQSEDEGFPPLLKSFLQEHWSEEAFVKGRAMARDHHVNMLRVLRRGCCPLRLHDLPSDLQLTISYISLCKECASSAGVLLPQRLRGEVIEAILQLHSDIDEVELLDLDKDSLLSLMTSRLPGIIQG
ncbi:hypothetical protein KP509_20G033100 [Ceratopteris richardii]|uniref:Ankyrin repeat protein SKIP35 n=1 Tax=Ceratopteris richardii TaxID=49495 RepID=A0A8T2SI63_CERRI|nr:hypothetical protein KP509_20G033100 [Ceratopteris richardii]